MIKGNFYRQSFVHENLKYLVKCLYAPNKDSIMDDPHNESTAFFKNMIDDTLDNNFHHCILTGNYNITINQDMDTNRYLHVNNPTSCQYFMMRLATTYLIDIWWLKNPNIREFTFDKLQRKNRTKARLDYFLISGNTAEIVVDTSTERACNLSDHRPINIELSSSPFVRGR